MATKGDKIRIGVIVAALLGAAAMFAYYYSSTGSEPKQTATSTPLEEVTTDRTGAKVIRSGSHAQREAPPKK